MKKSQKFQVLLSDLLSALSELAEFVGREVIPDLLILIRRRSAELWVVLKPGLDEAGRVVSGQLRCLGSTLRRIEWSRIASRGRSRAVEAVLPHRCKLAWAVVLLVGAVALMGLPLQLSEDRLVEVVSSESSAVADAETDSVVVIPSSAPTPTEVVEVMKEPAAEAVAKAAPEPEAETSGSPGLWEMPQREIVSRLELERQRALERSRESRELSLIQDIVAQQSIVHAADMQQRAQRSAMEAARRASRKFQSQVGPRMAARGVR